MQGIVRLGRQYNVLFDAFSATLASYKYSPFAEIYKPELGMTLGARQDNMVKYSFASGGLSGSLQLSAGEVSTNNKSAGGLVKYASGPFAILGTYLGVTDTAGKKATTNDRWRDLHLRCPAPERCLRHQQVRYRHGSAGKCDRFAGCECGRCSLQCRREQRLQAEHAAGRCDLSADASAEPGHQRVLL